MRFFRINLAVFALSLLTISVATPAFSQGITTGTIIGTVEDPSGAVIPGAQVELTSLATNVKLDQKSAADGSFKFSLVPIGAYSAQITVSGFATEDINNVRVVAGATTNLNEIKLHVATGQTQVVEVNGSAAALLDTTDSQVTTTFGTESMQNLPLNNGFDTMAELIPGVVSTTGDDNFSNTMATTIQSTARAGATTTSRSTARRTTTTPLPGRRSFSAARTRFRKSRSSPTTTAPSMAATPARSRITSRNPEPTLFTAAPSISTKANFSAR